MHRGSLLSFHTIFLVISRIMKGVLVCFSQKHNFLLENFDDVCSLLASIQVMSAPFGQCMQRHLMVGPTILLSLWKCHYVLFLLMWHVVADDRQFVVGGLFLLFIFSLFQRKYMPVFFLLVFFILVLIFFIVYFYHWPFYKSFLMFSIQSLNYNLSYIIFFKLSSYSFVKV